MEEYQVNVYVPVTKDYKVNRLTIRNVKYTGDCSGLAYWYYTNNPNSNNIIIHIHGGFHQTYPNPEHITVEYEDNGMKTMKYHMSIGLDGFFYHQALGGVKKKKSKKKKSKKKSSKKKSSKKE